MRLVSKEAREFQKLAESMGWEFAGVTSNGHLRWRHPDHEDLVTSATPRSWFWARKDLYAAMGLPVPSRARHRSKGPEPKREGPNKINALMRAARRRGHPMELAFAERILLNERGNLDRAMASLESLLDRAEEIADRRRRRGNLRVAQPWEPRPSTKGEFRVTSHSGFEIDQPELEPA